MSSSLSFNSTADQKGWVDTGKKVLNTASSALGVGCSVGTIASFVFPPAAPLTGAVCTGAAVTGAASRLVGGVQKN